MAARKKKRDVLSSPMANPNTRRLMEQVGKPAKPKRKKSPNRRGGGYKR